LVGDVEFGNGSGFVVTTGFPFGRGFTTGPVGCGRRGGMGSICGRGDFGTGVTITDGVFDEAPGCGNVGNCGRDVP
jgi:hypothetical protein